MIANLIATPGHTLYLTKVRVSFVRKVSGKIKMERQIVLVVEVENTTIKQKARQSLIVKVARLVSIKMKLDVLSAKVAQTVSSAQSRHQNVQLEVVHQEQCSSKHLLKAVNCVLRERTLTRST